MPYVKLNGIDIYYGDWGQGQVILFIHGLGSSLCGFRDDLVYFKNQYRVVSLDLRGHGRSSKPKGYSLDDHISDVVQLIDYLKLKNLIIVGSSMGTYIAQGLALNRPDLLKKLVLISGKIKGKGSSIQRLQKEHKDLFQFLNLSEEEKLDHLQPYIYYNLEAIEAYSEELKDCRTDLTNEQLIAANEAIQSFDFSADLRRVEVDSLIIQGRHDGLNPVREGERLAQTLQKAKLVIFEKSGHNPAIEEREKYLRVMKSFLQQ